MNGKLFMGSVLAGVFALAHTSFSAEWKPVAGSMLTEWGENISPDNAWTEYPRPQMVRKNWTNLNGMWEYSITRQSDKRAGTWDGEILVPFAIEAPLSGVGRSLEPYEALWYRRNFKLQKEPKERLLLHFEAVDYQSIVWVNGKEVGGHVGGNLPFSFDITDQVKAGRNTLVLKVVDRTNMDDSFQLRGKQRLVNRGIFYTRVSGIWQSVWLEPVPENHIKSLKVGTKMNGEIRIEPSFVGQGNIRTEAWLDGRKVAEGSTVVKVDQPKLWSPASPTLYQLKVFMQDESGQDLDRVESYAGIREVGKIKDKDGNWRFTLNGKTIFHWGPLDQGWWPDGLLTPPSEDAMLFEINFLKQAGFNMIRKHIKVEPRLYYYHCDRLGMLVWQDQVSGGPNPNWYRLDPSRNKKHRSPEPGDPIDAEWPDAAHEQWMAELKGMIDHLYNYPSIVSWVPFNEAWGQHRTMEVGEWVMKYDPSRSINIASGGNFAPVGDIADMHSYPHPEFPFHMNEYDDYIKVVGEFGGHGWKVDGHEWDPKKKNFIYGGMPNTIDEYAQRYAESIRLLGELKTQGVSGGVYTQTTDVEGEINGLMTYDRKVIKISAEELKALQSQNGLLGHLASKGKIPTNTSTTVNMDPIYQEVHAAPDVAGCSLQIVVEATQRNAVADGVLLAHGGNVTGYSLHVEQGIPVFEVTWKKEIFRIAWSEPVKGKMRIVADLGENEMSLSVNGEPKVSAISPGLLRTQPKIGLSVGYDALSNAGFYEVPNPYNGTILSTRIDAGGTLPAVAKVMPRSEIEAGLASHDQSLFIKEGWIRDPYVILGPDDYYYLTGTTPNPGDSREQSDPYNTGLGNESIVGWKAQVWRSKDLIDWVSLGTPFTLKEGIWFEKRPKRFEDVPEKLWFLWAPEVHWLGDRWALTHTSPSPVRGANLALTEGADLKGPWTHPMGAKIGHRHDPSLFKDDGTWYLLYGNTQVVPLNADFSLTTAEPVQIDPSGSRTTPAGETVSVIGHEGATMRKIGDKYVHMGTAWSTDTGRKGSYNLYYCTADKITGPYGERKFIGRFLGHGTPFQDKQGRWWCTAFYNGNIPPVERKGIEARDLSATAQTINQRGVTIVPLDVKVLEDGEIYIRAKDPAYANPGPDEVQQFAK